MARVVAVSGPAGAGKSTLVASLARALPGAGAVHMDRYETMTRLPIAQVQAWAHAGADFDAFDFSGLAADLETLRRGGSVVEPGSGRKVGPADIVVFETQFGRAHRVTGGLIDLLVWIDIPLDVALARNVCLLLDTSAREADDAALRGHLRRIRSYLDNYLVVVRSLMATQRERVRPGADIVVDGLRDPESIARAAEREIRARLS